MSGYSVSLYLRYKILAFLIPPPDSSSVKLYLLARPIETPFIMKWNFFFFLSPWWGSLIIYLWPSFLLEFFFVFSLFCCLPLNACFVKWLLALLLLGIFFTSWPYYNHCFMSVFWLLPRLTSLSLSSFKINKKDT